VCLRAGSCLKALNSFVLLGERLFTAAHVVLGNLKMVQQHGDYE
jgi:hypothetical protein